MNSYIQQEKKSYKKYTFLQQAETLAQLYNISLYWENTALFLLSVFLPTTRGWYRLTHTYLSIQTRAKLRIEMNERQVGEDAGWHYSQKFMLLISR